jgi:hypothetical protein
MRPYVHVLILMWIIEVFLHGGFEFKTTWVVFSSFMDGFVIFAFVRL